MSKAFFFDIDGTLLDTPSGLNDISDKNKQAILKLQKDGHSAFIATGRTKCFIVPPIRQFPFSGFVSCNGAYVEYDHQCIYKQVLSSEAILKLIEVAKKNDFDFYIEGYDSIYVNDLNKKSVNDFAVRWQMPFDKMVDQFNPYQIETYIAMVKVNDESEFDILFSSLSNYFDISRHPNQLSFDLNVKGISKGIGILELIKKLGWNKQDTYAFGDGNNDMEMITTVGHGIAMGNAVETLKEAAVMVTDDVYHDGVYTALKKLGFVE